MISSKTLWDRDNRNNGISGAIRLGDKTKKGRSVGTYYSEWYGFEVASKRHLMDLLIEPSFDHAICVQFHEMQDGEYRAFYNYQPSWKEIVDAVKAYAYEQKMDPSTKANAALDIAAYAGVFKPLAPVFDYLLEEEELRYVEELYINELPETDEHHIGLDGHSYTLRVYKNGEEKCYKTWCVTPLSWDILKELVRTVVDRLELKYESYGAYVYP